MAGRHKVYLLLGGNISPRMDYLTSAKKLIRCKIGSIRTCSAVYESEAWGFDADTLFLNQVLLVYTSLDARELLTKSQEIENKLGRTRKSAGFYSSRTIDIDILFFDDVVLSTPVLKIPHEQLQNRKFTLMPLAEIAPGFQHPALKKSCRRLLEECNDPGKVRKLQSKEVHEI